MKLIDSKLKPVIDSLPGSKVRPLAVAMLYCEQIYDSTLAGSNPPGGASVRSYLKMLEFVIENELRLVEEETYVRNLLEDGEGGGDGGGAPANSVAGVEPRDEPVIEPATKKNKKNMDTKAAYASLFAR